VTDDDAMQAGLDLSQLEGIIPAIETSHALAVLNDKKFKPEWHCGNQFVWSRR
jgi:tryptophan synthase beta chain